MPLTSGLIEIWKMHESDRLLWQKCGGGCAPGFFGNTEGVPDGERGASADNHEQKRSSHTKKV
jgi:hypothetical protein